MKTKRHLFLILHSAQHSCLRHAAEKDTVSTEKPQDIQTEAGTEKPQDVQTEVTATEKASGCPGGSRH